MKPPNFAPYEPLKHATHHIIIYLPVLHLSLVL